MVYELSSGADRGSPGNASSRTSGVSKTKSCPALLADETGIRKLLPRWKSCGPRSCDASHGFGELSRRDSEKTFLGAVDRTNGFGKMPNPADGRDAVHGGIKLVL